MSQLNFQFHHYPTLGSTNNEAIRLANEGKEEGTVVTADFQTDGKGRNGNHWDSARDRDLLLSVVLRPVFSTSRASGLTLVAARAVQKALDSFNIASAIKKPNDVLVGGKKISGILTESRSQGDKIDWCVVGVGLNINSLQDEIPEGATSMRLAKGQELDREHVKERVLKFFAEEYQQYQGSY